MKNYQYLESSTKLSQLEARLSLNSYLSKGSLPTGADATVLLFLQEQKKIPNRQIYPNLYHWFILMKQFSLRTLQIWQQEGNSWTDEDSVIREFIQSQRRSASRENSLVSSIKGRKASMSRLCKDNADDEMESPKKSSKKNSNISGVGSRGCSGSEQLIAYSPYSKLFQSCKNCSVYQLQKEDSYPFKLDIQCVMEMHLKSEESTSIHEFKERLEDERLKLVSMEGQEEKIRIVFKTDSEHIEMLKDRISQWEQISHLQFRKEKRMNCKVQAKSEKLIGLDKHFSHFVN